MPEKLTVLCVAAHPDDIEFLMSGTLMLLRDAGYAIHYMNLSNGSLGTTELSTPAIIKEWFDLVLEHGVVVVLEPILSSGRAEIERPGEEGCHFATGDAAVGAVAVVDRRVAATGHTRGGEFVDVVFEDRAVVVEGGHRYAVLPGDALHDYVFGEISLAVVVVPDEIRPVDHDQVQITVVIHVHDFDVS